METLNIEIPIKDDTLPGFLDLPQRALGLVVFAHGSGSNRFSRRTRSVAGFLNRARLATLRFDLLTAAEHEIDRQPRELGFHVPLLTQRLIAAVDWARGSPQTSDLNIGLFGSSTGAAAALFAAVARPDLIRALVSRGGYLDLAAEVLAYVQVPTLLIVGGLDRAVLKTNRGAASQMPVEPRLEVIPGASHLFEEAGKLDAVAMLARDWFLKRL